MDKNDEKPRPRDIAPVLGICLVTTLMALIVAVVMKAEPIILVALAGVLTALAVMLRPGVELGPGRGEGRIGFRASPRPGSDRDPRT